jgi:activator-of-BECN1-regulated-autophagy protein 1
MAFHGMETLWSPFQQVDIRDLVDSQISGHLHGWEHRGCRSLSDVEGAAPAPVPDRATMEARWAFREASRRETNDHRRTVSSGGETISLARNVAHALHHRELHGSRSLATMRKSGHCGAVPRKRAVSSGDREGRDGGDRSPLTVFESPISTTTSPSRYDRDEVAKPDDTRIAPTMDGFKRNRSESDDVVRSARERVRRICYPMSVSREIQSYAEHCSAIKYQSVFLHHLGGDDELDEEGNRPTSSRAVSTISVSFSPDATTMASTHGDHTVKITCCNSGLLLQSLEGHPRTPWTVKYHPTRSEILASGCLGHQVRIWDWKKKLCIHMVRLEFAIISLSFHPSGQVLAIANGTRLHFWGVDCSESSQSPTSGGGGGGGNSSRSSSERRTAALTEMDLRHMLRCVHFPPNGKTLILGGVNPTSDEARRRNRTGTGVGGMSFYLRLWDFDLDRALNPQSDLTANGLSIARRPISNVSLVDQDIGDIHTGNGIHRVVRFSPFSASLEHLCHEPCSTTTEASMSHRTGSHCAHALSCGYLMALTTQWHCYGRKKDCTARTATNHRG